MRAARQVEIESFVVAYVEGMRRRLDEWKAANGDADKVSERELVAAIAAIEVEAGRTETPAKVESLLEDVKP
jgi:hypothetical protein